MGGGEKGAGGVEVLLSTLVHEVKNPLVAISTFAHLLPERYGEEEFRGEFSRLVGLEVRRLNGVLEMLLEYNQLGTPLPVDVDLSKWVMNYCDEKGRCVLQKILVDLAPSSSPVRFDDRHLNFVFERIFDRIQTRGIAGGKVRILCQGLRQGENWGKLDIGYEEPEPLVQPSSRKGPSAEDQDFEGLSLGLGLARRIMRKNNGEMSLLREEEGIARILLLFGSQAPSRSES
jgi:light-regulated signal transduction histidine kinase (bacteriophytochrome)